MATSKLELAVDAGRWEEGLRKASSALNNFVQAQGGIHAALSQNEDKMTSFVRIMGNVTSSATTAKGRLGDYKKSFEQLTEAYNQLSDAEKAGKFGQQLQQTLDKLRGRISDTKSEIENLNSAMGESSTATTEESSILDRLAGNFGITSAEALKLSAALAAIHTAFKVAADAFSHSESAIDEWGRTVEGAKAAYDVFLSSINGGNWSNFLSNLSNAINGARALYDSLDRLGSIRNNNSAAIAIVEQQLAQLRLMKQQGKDVDEQLKAATEKLSALRNQAVEAGKVAGTKQIVETIKNDSNGRNTTGVKISDEAYERAAKLIETGGQKVFDAYKRNAEMLEKAGMVTKSTAVQNGSSVYGSSSDSVDYQVFDLSKLTQEQQKQYLIAKAITEGETRIKDGIATYAQAVQEQTSSQREEFRYNRIANDNTNATKSSSAASKEELTGPLVDMEKKLAELEKAQHQASSPEEWQNFEKQIKAVEFEIDAFKGKLEKLEKGKQATFTLTVDKSQLDELMKSLPDGVVTEHVDVSVDDSELEKLPVDGVVTERVDVSVDDSELEKLPVDGTVTEHVDIRVDDAELEKLPVDGVVTERVDIRVDDAELEKLPVDGTVTEHVDIRVDDAELEKLPVDGVVTERVDIRVDDAELEKLPVDGTVTEHVDIRVDDAELEKLPVDGTVTISITADTDEAYRQVESLTKNIEGRKVSITAVPDTVDFSRATSANISSLTNSIRQQLQDTEYGTALYDALQSQLADASLLKNIIEQWTKAGLDMVNLDTSGLYSQLLNGDIPDETWYNIAATINEHIEDLDIKPIVINVKTGGVETAEKDAKNLARDWQNVGQALNAVGSAFDNIEDPAAKAMSTVMQAIATVALSFSQALSKSAQEDGPWGWIAFAATGAATMISTIASIKKYAAGAFADGGIVPGNYNGGKDSTFVYASPGELILNRAQQQSIANQLTSVGSPEPTAQNSIVTGEQIIMAVNAWGRRTGRGEILQ